MDADPAYVREVKVIRNEREPVPNPVHWDSVFRQSDHFFAPGESGGL